MENPVKEPVDGWLQLDLAIANKTVQQASSPQPESEDTNWQGKPVDITILSTTLCRSHDGRWNACTINVDVSIGSANIDSHINSDSKYRDF